MRLLAGKVSTLAKMNGTVELRLATFFDRIAHSLEIICRYTASKADEVCSWYAAWLERSEFPCELQDLLLLGLGQTMNQFHDLSINHSCWSSARLRNSHLKAAAQARPS